MDMQKITNCIGKGAFVEAENAWMAAVRDDPAPELVNKALCAFVAAGKEDMAETLGWALLEAHAESPKEQTLALACAAYLALPGSEELRSQTAELFKAAYGDSENFEEIYKAAGLETGQSARRAIRTLQTCLALTPGVHLVNRFDGRLIKIIRLTPMGEFEFHDFADKRDEAIEPKLLADEFDPLDEADFRAMQLAGVDAMTQLVQKEIARVLIGLCIANAGQADSDTIKQTLVPKYLPASKWSSWWGRARTAAKKSENLTLEGRSPVVVIYHPGGKTLEEEYLASQAYQGAYHPIDWLGVLQNYMRDASARGDRPDANFTATITAAIAQRTLKCASSSQLAEALEGVLVLEIAGQMGIAPPGESLPGAIEILDKMKDPAEAVAKLPEADLWPGAIKAVHDLSNGPEIFEQLLYLAPLEQLDTIAANLAELGNNDAPSQAVARAIISPIEHIDLCLWVWLAEGQIVVDQPGKLTMLMKLLDLAHEIDHNWPGDQASRKNARQKVRQALSAGDYAIYQQALDEADEAMGSVVKTKIERTDSLAQALSEQMINRLREKFFSLFVKARVNPWEDESVIWTSEAALEAHHKELKVLKEVTMPANAKQIGEAAEEGDLRENADWQAAIEERDMLVARARKIQDELARARAIHITHVPKDSIGIGSRVTLRRVADGETFEMSFLGPWDSDTANGIYAYTTKLAKNLMGKKIGDTLSLEIAGQQGQFTIDSLAAAI